MVHHQHLRGTITFLVHSRVLGDKTGTQATFTVHHRHFWGNATFLEHSRVHDAIWLNYQPPTSYMNGWACVYLKGVRATFHGQRGRAGTLRPSAAILEQSNYWSNVHMLTHSALVMSPPQVYLLWYFRTNWDLHHEFPVRMTI